MNMRHETVTITGDAKVAEELNNFFVNKIANLKETIDNSNIEDPLEKLRGKMADRNLKFALKTVTEKMVSKVMRSMKKKTSKGEDGISQDVIMVGEKVLLTPITHIINASIASGKFPDNWKKALFPKLIKLGKKLPTGFFKGGQGVQVGGTKPCNTE